jgi:two-component system, NtrC family, C4-dicarboxylate transport sensor histidine kinase DctB
MTEVDADEVDPGLPQGMSWRAKVAIALLLLFAVAVVLTTNRWLSDRFTDSTRNRAELRLALYSGNMMSELQRTAVVPLLLARDPELIEALSVGNFSDRNRCGIDTVVG